MLKLKALVQKAKRKFFNDNLINFIALSHTVQPKLLHLFKLSLFATNSSIAAKSNITAC